MLAPDGARVLLSTWLMCMTDPDRSWRKVVHAIQASRMFLAVSNWQWQSWSRSCRHSPVLGVRPLASLISVRHYSHFLCLRWGAWIMWFSVNSRGHTPSGYSDDIAIPKLIMSGVLHCLSVIIQDMNDKDYLKGAHWFNYWRERGIYCTQLDV